MLARLKSNWYSHTYIVGRNAECTGTLENSSAVCFNKLLICTATWMNLKGIMVVEEVIFEKCPPCDSIYMTFWEKQKCIDGEQVTGCHGLRAKGGFDYRWQHKEFLWDIENVLYLICNGSYRNLHICKNSQNCSQRKVNFIVYILKH